MTEIEEIEMPSEMEETLEGLNKGLEETGQKSKIVSSNDDDEAEERFTGSFLDKKDYVGKKIKVLSLGHKLLKGKDLFAFSYKDTEYLIDLNNRNWNFLKNNFGKKFGDWKNHEMYITFDSYQDIDKNGEVIKGVSTIFSL